jgi:integrase
VTVIVGVRCSDGIVIGTDSAATSTAGQIPVLRTDIDKFFLVGDRTIIAGSGAIGLTWAELSGDFSTWTIPASRAKNGTTHIVPLASPAQDLLREAPRFGELVFPGLRGPFNGWSKAKAALDAKSGATNWRLHDLRRTMATGLQRLGVRLEVTEQVLNHVSGSRAGIVGVYQRHDFANEKRAALEAWGEHVEAIVEGRTPESNVLKLHA